MSEAEKIKKPQFDQDQYDMLIRCSAGKDITEWNQWRQAHPGQEIFLEGARFARVHLEGANFREAHLEGAVFSRAHLEGADLFLAQLEGANFFAAQLKRSNFGAAELKGARFHDAHLEGVDFFVTHLEGASFRKSSTNRNTSFWYSYIDRKTDFRNVSLESIRIEQGKKQLLEYNNRRMNWEDWYRGKFGGKWKIRLHQFATLPVRLFWVISDYGASMMRIIATFFILAFIFAVIYRIWPGLVVFNCKTDINEFRSLWHATYFSVITMTTLGFGDIAANPDSWQGQGLLMLQVLMGYVLLGALITRFSVLFTAGGPAGKFSKTNP